MREERPVIGSRHRLGSARAVRAGLFLLVAAVVASPPMLRADVSDEADLRRPRSDGNDAPIPTVGIVPNPPLGRACGLDIALLLDMTGSINANEQTDTVKAAAKIFIDSFQPGTPTAIGLVELSNGFASIVLGLSDDPDALKAAIDGLSPGGLTNWEEALLMGTDLLETPPSNAPDIDDRDDDENPDLIIIFTDGDPTASSAGPGDGTQPNIHLAPAVAAADLTKSSSSTLPIRIVAIGVGDASEQRLVVISGPNVARELSEITRDTDVVLGDFSDLADILSALAIEFCGGALVVNTVIDEDGDLATTDDQTTSGKAVADWVYSFTVTNGSADPPTASTDTTGATGDVLIDLEDGIAGVDVTETVKPGFDLFAAECTGATGNGAFVDGTDSVESLEVGQGDVVVCTFYNTPQCTSNEECDDGVPCTVDVCDPVDPSADDLGCVSTPDNGFCDDGVACTRDACDPSSSTANSDGCVFTENDGDCTDGIACTDGVCDPSDPAADSDGCVFDPDDADCDDEISCTDDVCDPSDPAADADGCVFDPNDARCDDGDPCTAEVCTLSGCEVTSEILCGSCCVGGGECLDDLLADDCLTNPDHRWRPGVSCDMDCIKLPTVSTWGRIALVLLLVTGLTIVVRGRSFVARPVR